jgi:hypothetical protein
VTQAKEGFLDGSALSGSFYEWAMGDLTPMLFLYSPAMTDSTQRPDDTYLIKGSVTNDSYSHLSPTPLRSAEPGWMKNVVVDEINRHIQDTFSCPEPDPGQLIQFIKV